MIFYTQAFSNQLVLNSNGRIGINKANPTTQLEIYNGTFKISGESSLQQETARFVMDMGSSYSHRFLEFRNSQGVQVVIEGNGKLYAKEVQVTLSSPLGDFVFDEDYSLMTIYELHDFIKNNHHLPGVPSAKEVSTAGLNLGDMNNILLQKVEELTLYIIQQQKTIDELQLEVAKLKKN